MRTVRTFGARDDSRALIGAAELGQGAGRHLANCHGRTLAKALLPLLGDPRRVEVIVDAALEEARSVDGALPADRRSVDAWLLALAHRRLADAEARPWSDHHQLLPPGPAGPRRPATLAAHPITVVPRRQGSAGRDHAPHRTWHAALWIAAAVLALAAVALALAMRPAAVVPRATPPHADTVPRALVAAEPRVAPITPPTRTGSVAASAPGLRLFVHHSGGTAADRALLVADYLAQAGFTVARLRAVPVTIATATVRYFFDEDRAAAAAVAAALDRLDEGKPARGPRRVVDLTRYRPLPARGTVEVWLPPALPAGR